MKRDRVNRNAILQFLINMTYLKNCLAAIDAGNIAHVVWYSFKKHIEQCMLEIRGKVRFVCSKSEKAVGNKQSGANVDSIRCYSLHVLHNWRALEQRVSSHAYRHYNTGCRDCENLHVSAIACFEISEEFSIKSPLDISQWYNECRSLTNKNHVPTVL